MYYGVPKAGNEAPAVCVQNIGFTIACDFIDLASQNHFLDTAAINSIRFARKSENFADLIQFHFPAGNVRSQYIAQENSLPANKDR